MRLKRSSVFGCVVVMSIGAISGAAHAGASGTNSVACGSAPASWNAPAGSLVLSRSHGIVGAVLNGVGEYYTHSMLSHGPGSAVTHSTMYTPGTNGWPKFCSTPVNQNELKNGYPGVSQINNGGIYAFLYLDGSGAERVIYQHSATPAGFDDNGVEVADWVMTSMPRSSVASRQDGGIAFERLAHPNTGEFFKYVLFQYRNLERLHVGEPAWNSGSVCSTFLAFSHYMSGKSALSPKVYDHDTIVNAGNVLYAQVEDECSSNTSWLLDVASTVACFEGICDDAARQVRNCMATGVCDSDSSSHWDKVRNNSSSIAVSISPDRLGGWSNFPYEGPEASVWAYHEGAEVEWNSGGDVYGCWF